MNEIRVLITGAAGKIGSVLVSGLKDRYQLRGFDRVKESTLPPYFPVKGGMLELEDIVIGDLADFDTMLKATKDMEVVIHLAAIASGAASWEEILRNNIIGTYNVFESSRQNGVRRVVFASRAGVLGPYPREIVRTADMVPRPNSYYSVSKVFGENLGFMYSYNYGMEVICVRIGNFGSNRFMSPSGKYPKGTKADEMEKFLSHHDAVHLFERCMIQPGIKYEVVFGVSNHSPRRFDLDYARRVLGYCPRDKVQDFIEDKY